MISNPIIFMTSIHCSLRSSLLLASLSGVVTLGSAGAVAQSFDLAQYLSYRDGVSSLFAPVAGFDLVMAGEGTANASFFWQATYDGGSLRQNFRVNDSGLAYFSQQGTTIGEPDDFEVYQPEWVVSPKIVTSGQVIQSSATYSGFEDGHSWTGTASGTLTVNGLETLTWALATSEVLKISFSSSWSDSDDYSGTSVQTWWMARGLGVVKLRYQFSEIDSDGETSEGDFTFEMVSSTLATAPTILSHPESRTVSTGASFSIRVVADGPGPITYQWRHDGIPLPDATQDSLNLSMVQAVNEGIYDVVVKNPFGEIVSEAAVLTLEQVIDPVTIPDPNLEESLRLALNKPSGGITQTDLSTLTSFIAIDQGIINLQGLEHAVNLRTLDLSQNAIVDLLPLSGLHSLTSVNLNFNAISNLEPVRTWSAVQQLFMVGNKIIDLAPLSELISLTRLNLTGNEIVDLSPLSTLVNLTQLDAADNAIVDLAPLTSLKNLRILQMPINRVRDLTPLAEMPALIAINLQNNFIRDLSPLAGRTGLTSFLIAANYLDLSVGSVDEQILATFRAGGTTVFSTPQNSLPAVHLSLTPSPETGAVTLSWNSQAGVTYRILVSQDLKQWSPLTAQTISGRGEVEQVDISLPAMDFFLQVQAELE